MLTSLPLTFMFRVRCVTWCCSGNIWWHRLCSSSCYSHTEWCCLHPSLCAHSAPQPAALCFISSGHTQVMFLLPFAPLGMQETNNKVVLLQMCTLFFISMAGVIRGLLTWDQQVHSAALAPLSSSTSLVEAITFGRWRFHLGCMSVSLCKRIESLDPHLMNESHWPPQRWWGIEKFSLPAGEFH